ncbi:type II 3-dehydroquinate dehydratase [Fodinibius sp.]|uniref:type II 3-dehydroquinate dehydratase n=1 Tax=Fodinibius sp. TaxID=1872440 RepID=UPI002ACDF28D|nr:type II 3-dehydroquinate dehydratase [Fodinibius sp.]MDZ7658175.1 type II 3-dehydroquinate dehydratase [Fodinibius sp.]
MKISVLNGPNLNMLGKRDPEQYGSATLEDIEQLLISSFPDHEMTFFQSNLEGELVEAIQSLMKSDFDGVIVNFGGFSHTSVAIRDALDLIDIPIVEVHLSNIHAREEFRERTLTGAVADGIITGFGKQSYLIGVHALEKLIVSK